MERTIPAFAFPTEAATHLPTPDRWKAELALSGWLHTEIYVWHKKLNPDIVTHLNRIRCRLTSLIKTDVLSLCQTTTLTNF